MRHYTDTVMRCSCSGVRCWGLPHGGLFAHRKEPIGTPQLRTQAPHNRYKRPKIAAKQTPPEGSGQELQSNTCLPLQPEHGQVLHTLTTNCEDKPAQEQCTHSPNRCGPRKAPLRLWSVFHPQGEARSALPRRGFGWQAHHFPGTNVEQHTFPCASIRTRDRAPLLSGQVLDIVKNASAFRRILRCAVQLGFLWGERDNCLAGSTRMARSPQLDLASTTRPAGIHTQRNRCPPGCIVAPQPSLE